MESAQKAVSPNITPQNGFKKIEIYFFKEKGCKAHTHGG